MVLVLGFGGWVCEVYDGYVGLLLVGLEGQVVGFFDEVVVFDVFGEKWVFLCDVGVDLEVDFQVFGVQVLEYGFGFGEVVVVLFEVVLLEFVYLEVVEVKD